MDISSDSTVFLNAGRAAHERLAELDQAIHNRKAELAALERQREIYARISSAAAELVGPEVGLPSILPAATQTAAQGSGQVDELPAPVGSARPISPEQTVYRVALILKQNREPMTREEIVDALVARGWAQESWSSVKGVVFSALRRAKKYDWIDQVKDSPGVYVTSARVANTEARAVPASGSGSE